MHCYKLYGAKNEESSNKCLHNFVKSRKCDSLTV